MRNGLIGAALALLVYSTTAKSQDGADLFLPPMQSWATIIESDANYAIVSRFSGKCLEARNLLEEGGGSFQQGECNGSANQLFKILDGYKYGWRIESVE